jgi:hypothetical protein
MLRDSRKKRGQKDLTKKFFDSLKSIDQVLPMNGFSSHITMVQPHSTIENDGYSNQLLHLHASPGAATGRIAKRVSANGNCLFNSASVALIGEVII